PATEDLRTYAVKVEDGEIFVDLDRAAEAQTPAATRAAQQSSIVSAASGARAPARADTEARDITVPGTLSNRYIWPAEGLSRIPDWVYTDQSIFEREVERIFHGPTWNFVALECEVPKAGDFIRSNVGPTPVVVARAADGSINVFENRCVHRASE